ncbi:hypothetical protein ScPMuIL_008297 [Solemya velum]
MASEDLATIALRRKENSRPWGFKMQGGAEVGQPLYVAQVNPKGIAGKAGMRPGDAILLIGRTDVTRASHEQAKMEMLRAGNDVDIRIKRGAVNVKAAKAATKPTEEPRVQLDESSIDPQMNEGGMYRDVNPKTYQVLKTELPQSEAAEGARPASIFDKRKGDRSEYTKTDKSSYQKAYGQS